MADILWWIYRKVRPLLYLIITFIIFFIFYVSIGEDPRDAINPALMVERTVYWFEIGRYAEDLKDIQYYGVVDVMMVGDTTGLPFHERFLEDYLESRVDRYLRPYRNYATTLSDPKGFYETHQENKIGRIVVDLKLTQIIGFPIIYRMKLICGNERDEYVYTAILLSTVKKYKMIETFEQRIDFLVRKYAERFNRIKADYT